MKKCAIVAEPQGIGEQSIHVEFTLEGQSRDRWQQFLICREGHVHRAATNARYAVEIIASVRFESLYRCTHVVDSAGVQERAERRNFEFSHETFAAVWLSS